MLYTEEMSDREIKDQAQVPSLKLKIYERIPIPDLPVNTSTFSINLCLFIAMLFTTDILLFFFFRLKKLNLCFLTHYVGYFSSQEAIFPYTGHGMKKLGYC